MNQSVTKFILTALAYIIPTMLLGYCWHLILFKGLYDSLGIYNRVEPIIPLGFFSMIIQGLIIAYLYPSFAKDKISKYTALKFCLIMGLFLFSVSTLANGAKIMITSMQSWLQIQIVFHLLQFTIAGILIGLVNRK